MTVSAVLWRFWVDVVIANKFLGCADDRKFDPVPGKASADSFADVRIGDVFAVPSQEKLHPVNGGATKVEGVSCRDRRENQSFDQFACQSGNLFVNIQ